MCRVLGGSVAGAVAIVIVDLVVGHPHPPVVPLSAHVLESALAMAVDAFMYALADGVVTGTYIHSGRGGVALELSVALIAGSIAGALGGTIVHHIDLFVEVGAAFLRPIWPTISRIVLRSCKVCLEHSAEKTGVQMLHCCIEKHERHHHKKLYRQASYRITQEFENKRATLLMSRNSSASSTSSADVVEDKVSLVPSSYEEAVGSNSSNGKTHLQDLHLQQHSSEGHQGHSEKDNIKNNEEEQPLPVFIQDESQIEWID